MKYYDFDDIDKVILSKGGKIMPRQARLDRPGTLSRVSRDDHSGNRKEAHFR
jgi:hypothetical protein